MESITIKYKDKEYTGEFDIVKVGQTRLSFNVSFEGYHHEDSSLFKPGTEQQMKIHAKFVLEGLVRQYLNEKTQ